MEYYFDTTPLKRKISHLVEIREWKGVIDEVGDIDKLKSFHWDLEHKFYCDVWKSIEQNTNYIVEECFEKIHLIHVLNEDENRVELEVAMCQLLLTFERYHHFTENILLNRFAQRIEEDRFPEIYAWDLGRLISYCGGEYLEQSLNYYRKAVEIVKNKVGDKNYNYFSALEILGGECLRCKKFIEAEVSLRTAYEGLETLQVDNKFAPGLVTQEKRIVLHTRMRCAELLSQLYKIKNIKKLQLKYSAEAKRLEFEFEIESQCKITRRPGKT